MSNSTTEHGLLFVLSGPSGVGKDAAILRLKDLSLRIHHLVTATTRPARMHEIDGVHYHFLTSHTFEHMRDNGDLLEWANVHDYMYGSPINQVRENIQSGHDVMLKIDVQGARQVKQRVPDAVFIFLAPPSIEELVHRLTERGTETQRDFQIRIRNAYVEMEALGAYDYVVVNHKNQLEDAVCQIKAVVEAERCRVQRRHIVL